MTRILVFNWRDLGHPKAGGAEVYTHEVARSWVALGHEVTVFCGSAPDRPAVECIDGVLVVRRGRSFMVYREARRFYRDEGRGQYDLVIDEVNTRPFLCPTFVTDVPVVALIHQVAQEVWFREFPFPVAIVGRYVLEPRWLRKYRNVPVLTVSESSRESLLHHGLNDVRVVPEGVAAPDPLPTPRKESRPTIVFVGRLASNKRPDHALAAFELLRKHLPDSQLWMVGTGPLERELRARASEAVRFFGWVSNEEKFELLARAHVLVSTSTREGWGLVVSEAASVGTPSVAYNVPGLRDSVAAAGGVLVPPDPSALAAALSAHLPEWRERSPIAASLAGVMPWADVARAILAELDMLANAP